MRFKVIPLGRPSKPVGHAVWDTATGHIVPDGVYAIEEMALMKADLLNGVKA